MIRVGRRIGNTNPEYDGFEQIIVVMKSHCQKWYPLSPYDLRDENGHIMENIWQFSKCYATVPKSIQYYSQWNKKVIWDWPAQIHIDNNELTSEYFQWRNAGFANPYAVRYPVGYNYRNTVVCSYDNDGNRLDYVSARKQIYTKVYSRLAKQTPEFQELRQKLLAGTNLLIVDVDGPHQESLDHYKKLYNVDDNFIEKHSMLATTENLNIVLYDTKHSFGHGYVLAAALQGLC